MSSAAAYQLRRHPFIGGIILLIVGPYLLCFIVAFTLLYLAAEAALMVAGRR